jgi:uncharacterized cofD-like protein
VKRFFHPFVRFWRDIARWLLPGLGVKRWFLVTLLGVTLLGVGMAMLLLDFYRTAEPAEDLLVVIDVATLRVLPRWVRVVVFGGAGLALIGWGLWGLNRSLVVPFLRPGVRLVDQIAAYRRKERGPRIVALGGGHGLSTLLRGLKAHSANLTAIVSVADDGGSSGELRRTMGILPPGDIRNCLAALSNDEALLTQLFQYRFSGESGLSGHSFGNLFISALAEVTGSFEEAVAESGRVLSVNGRVLPATLHNVHLGAEVQLPNTTSRVRVEGESNIPKMAGQVRRVYLEPNNPPAFPPVIQALLSADLIVIGPGSLYTSILPNLLVPDIAAAIRASRAVKIFVCNIATQAGETQSFTCSDHIRALDEHVDAGLVDLALANDNYDGSLPGGGSWVQADHQKTWIPLHTADLVDREHPWRHDSARLAQTIMDVFFERTGPLGE